MNTKITIAGLDFSLQFCRKINHEPIASTQISDEPIVNIYENKNENSYVVNIVSYLPPKLKKLSKQSLSSGLFLDEEKTLFLNYTGVNNINTSISKDAILCRAFNLIYDQEDSAYQYYDLYHVQFEYKLLNKDFQSVEGIIIHDINVDPETDRGTVTTVRVDEQ